MTRARSAQRRIFLDAAAEAAFGRAGLRQCDHPNCAAKGLFPAPKSREPRDGRWHFCPEHVRQYNSGWDFFRGMSDAERSAEHTSELQSLMRISYAVFCWKKK